MGYPLYKSYPKGNPYLSALLSATNGDNLFAQFCIDFQAITLSSADSCSTASLISNKHLLDITMDQ